MEIIIFQLLSCLYFYDSGIEVPVCIRKPSRSTDCWQPREVCAKSVDCLPASKGLNLFKILINHKFLVNVINVFINWYSKCLLL